MQFGAGGQPLPSQASHWPTPTATDTKGASPLDRRPPSDDDLATAVTRWPSPAAANAKQGSEDLTAKRARSSKTGLMLTDVAADLATKWPTPAARDYKGANSTDHLDASTGALHLDQLPNFVAHVLPKNWPTPDSGVFNDSEDPASFLARQAELKAKGINGNGAGLPLAMASKLWVTPRVHEVGQYQNSKGDPDKPTPTLTGQALSLPAPTSSTDGEMSSEDPPSLSPHFVEWLMAWPPCWTMLALTDFGCSETGLSLWWQDMRSALLQLPLHQAPAPQLSLFG